MLFDNFFAWLHLNQVVYKFVLWQGVLAHTPWQFWRAKSWNSLFLTNFIANLLLTNCELSWVIVSLIDCRHIDFFARVDMCCSIPLINTLSSLAEYWRVIYTSAHCWLITLHIRVKTGRVVKFIAHFILHMLNWHVVQTEMLSLRQDSCWVAWKLSYR